MELIESLKISLFVRGIRISPDAEKQMTMNGHIPLTVHEYATTGGVTLILNNGIYVNAPFDEEFCTNPEATLLFDVTSESYVVMFRGNEIQARFVPLPGYLHSRDSSGRPVTATIFSHADRVRISPIQGCTMSCKFCDVPGQKYDRRPLGQILEGLDIAKADKVLPVYHVLISGGTPSQADFRYFDDICREVVSSSGMPVDVMMPPRPRDASFFQRLVALGVHGFSINLEVFDDKKSKEIIREKHSIGHQLFKDAIENAVQGTSGHGRVRSLIVIGLETEKETLEGVSFLASLGCDPVLSPFRPSRGTALSGYPPPTFEYLERVYYEAKNITEKFGVKLGPRCIPCQHNTLTFPDASGAYYYSERDGSEADVNPTGNPERY